MNTEKSEKSHDNHDYHCCFCHHFQLEGYRWGYCTLLNSYVKGNIDACQASIPPFKTTDVQTKIKEKAEGSTTELASASEQKEPLKDITIRRRGEASVLVEAASDKGRRPTCEEGDVDPLLRPFCLSKKRRS
ncbi:hypothetical protein Xen7305DRAFT_00032100 [Xenococcus sp. PCC 7305]|uniref:hypothetical protein n=1 Tax=Xenococcus sp. PCC 7305 TaxID=102125 RepID=UPI0002AD10A4|nr:hypothetical protein [Xenococcus sp. PCC 7305]ELS03486.1 hypothetical protein Xen7305DRAFT_00032100 [Xenococcus sp. PCC 7305]